jgi:hypothetical protein
MTAALSDIAADLRLILNVHRHRLSRSDLAFLLDRLSPMVHRGDAIGVDELARLAAIKRELGL